MEFCFVIFRFCDLKVSDQFVCSWLRFVALQMIMLEGAKATTETVDALRSGASAMKAIQKATYDARPFLLTGFWHRFLECLCLYAMVREEGLIYVWNCTYVLATSHLLWKYFMSEFEDNVVH